MQIETKDIKNIRVVMEVLYQTGEQNLNAAIKGDIDIFLTRFAEYICSLRIKCDNLGIVANALKDRQRLINEIKEFPENGVNCYRFQLKEKVIKLWKQQN